MKITNEIFCAHIFCKRKSFFIKNRKSGIKSEYEIFQNELRGKYKFELLKIMHERYKKKNIYHNKIVGHKELSMGKELLSDVTIIRDKIQVTIDALEKNTGKSKLGFFYYSPVLFVPNNKVKKDEKMLLGYFSYILEWVQGRPVEHGKVLYGNQQKINKINLSKYEDKARIIIEDLKKESMLPKVFLNKHCIICEFQKNCESEAHEKDDLSLLRAMKEKEIVAQNKKGIFTVTQFSYTFRPRRRRKQLSNSHNHRYHALINGGQNSRRVAVEKCGT